MLQERVAPFPAPIRGSSEQPLTHPFIASFRALRPR